MANAMDVSSCTKYQKWPMVWILDWNLFLWKELKELLEWWDVLSKWMINSAKPLCLYATSYIRMPIQSTQVIQAIICLNGTSYINVM